MSFRIKNSSHSKFATVFRYFYCIDSRIFMVQHVFLSCIFAEIIAHIQALIKDNVNNVSLILTRVSPWESECLTIYCVRDNFSVWIEWSLMTGGLITESVYHLCHSLLNYKMIWQLTRCRCRCTLTCKWRFQRPRITEPWFNLLVTLYVSNECLYTIKIYLHWKI